MRHKVYFPFFSSHPLVTIILLFFIMLTLPFLLLALETPQEVRQHAASTTSYPANIEYDGNNLSYGQYNQSSLTNPNIDGVDVIMNWADVEPQQGVFNWTPADNEIAAWAAKGKKFTMVIRYIHELKQPSCTSSPQWLPAWEQARVPHFCTTGGEVVPDYFDPTFKADLEAYVSAIAQHIAASPYKDSLVYIRTGLGMAGEGYPCVNCGSSDQQQLNNWGYTTTKWAAWQKEIFGTYINIFSPITRAPLIYPLGFSDIDPTTNQSISQELGYWAASQGMGVGQEGLNAGAGYASGQIVQLTATMKEVLVVRAVNLFASHQCHLHLYNLHLLSLQVNRLLT